MVRVGTIYFGFVILSLLVGCNAPTPSALIDTNLQEPKPEPVRYVSTNGKSVMVFSANGYRSGDRTALDDGRWPDYPKRDVQTNGVQCISVGPLDNSVEFAVKRPIKLGDIYKCGKTTFEVENCFNECESAIIRQDAPLTGEHIGTLPTYMIVDDCIGITAISPMNKISSSIPLDALLLRGNAGILKDKTSRCR